MYPVATEASHCTFCSKYLDDLVSDNDRLWGLLCFEVEGSEGRAIVMTGGERDSNVASSCLNLAFVG